ncbi:hypothetical protein SAMN06269185_1378 [Natronoarchaeum philippinense]|uniref:UPF0215 protein SAMN06269185_1378 n=1 Tax=Natronoarchaeum philippinense TaxID=558529 RepID=A0A285NV05_NATPI|nr:DUF99 family protein [Natronoarchaeum philippinense]SNZ11706.1 hypothetical protein SAMN06269185_1378 [Natronoarchaeum philippinense]
MKPGTRALGVAESYDGSDEATDSTLAGAVVRADRVVDGVGFERCTVGGTDATESVRALTDRLAREDVRYVFLAGIALAWYNVADLHGVYEVVERPVLSVSFEESTGLDDAIAAAFDGAERERRLAIYRDQPPRHRVAVDGDDVYVRWVGTDEDTARRVVREFTPAGGRPEPLRVARLAARAGHEYRCGDGSGRETRKG